MSRYFMGIDIGTFESKGVIIDENAAVIARKAKAHLMEVPKPGYAEHDALESWWGDFCTISHALLEESGIKPELIECLGCSTIAPCCLPVDRHLNPLRKAILYGIDVRATREIKYLDAKLGREAIFERCGTGLTTQSAAAKILWIKNNEPQIYEKTDRFVTGSTYLVAKLTGNYIIDHYTAATWVPLYDMKKLNWTEDTELFCRREQLAECRWSHEIAGVVSEKAALETGLAPGTKVTSGTADASAEAFSVGVLEPGDLMLMYGSSVFMIHVVKRFTKDKRLWAGPYLFPDTYSVAAGMSCAGTLTRWFRDNFAQDIVKRAEETGENAYAALAKLSEGIAPGSEGIIVLPYFSGERTPINDPQAKGLIFGLNLRHSRSHIYKACLEGVGYGIDQHFRIFNELGMDTRKIIAVGGGTKNRAWLQAVSDISAKEQSIAAEDTGAAYGDALIAALAIGHFKDTKELSEKIRLSGKIEPDAEKYAVYAPFREKYAKLYEATSDIMHMP